MERTWFDEKGSEAVRRTNMEGFFENVKELNPNCRNVAATVIEGEAFGEKALLSNGRLVWESEENGFFAAHREEAEAPGQEGVTVVAGSRVFWEVLGQEKRIVICGGGHVSVPVIRMGLMIGCSVTVLEDRPLFADHARRAGATEVICEPFSEGLAKIPGDNDTFFVIVTRGHRYDQVCLEQIVKKRHAYIGMIGSRLRVARVKEALREQGADPKVLEELHAPIGLDIGAETPEEIGVAIMAEIIQVKNREKRGLGYSGELLKAVSQQKEEPKVLATIVTRKGSAPRQIGTKMLIFQDGTCVGTIGGGCVEADIIGKARHLLHEGGHRQELHQVDMTGRDAEEEGMACGGIIQVLLEVV